METKTCSGCGNSKPIAEFTFRNKKKGIRHARCSECTRDTLKAHYAANVGYYVRKARKHRRAAYEENFQKLVEYLREHPCVDCGEDDICVLTFDHLRDKKYNISAMIHNCVWSSVQREIAKCEVRCANCHMRKTAKQRGFRKFALVA